MHESDRCDEVLVMIRRDAAERWSVILTTLLQPSRGPHGPKSMSMSAVRLKSFMPLVSAVASETSRYIVYCWWGRNEYIVIRHTRATIK